MSRKLEAEAIEEDRLVFVGAADAAAADVDSCGCGQDDVHGSDLADLVKDAPWFVAQSHIGKLDRGLDEAAKRGWKIVSMKNDWTDVFPRKK